MASLLDNIGNFFKKQVVPNAGNVVSRALPFAGAFSPQTRQVAMNSFVTPTVRATRPVVNKVLNFKPLNLTPASGFVNQFRLNNPTIRQFGSNALSNLNRQGIQTNKTIQYFSNPNKYSANKQTAEDFIGNVVGNIGGGEERISKQELSKAYKLFADQLKASPIINDITRHLDPQQIKQYVRTYARMRPHTNRDEFSNTAIKLAHFIDARERGLFSNKPPGVGLGLNVAERQEPKTPFENEVKAEQGNTPPTKFDVEAKNFGQQLRTWFTGERDVKVAQTNQLRNDIARSLKNPQDQEALTIYREFKNKPQELQQFLNGSHSFYDEILNAYKKRNPNATEQELAKVKADAVGRIQKLTPIIKRSLKPSMQIANADKAQSKYFASRLNEGKKLGIFDSKINPDEYINHILLTGDEPPKATTNLRGGNIGRSFEFGKERTFPTLLHAIAWGKNPSTLNALDAMTLYGSRHATSTATHELINTLKQSGIGKFGTRNSSNIPQDWVEVAPQSQLFRNTVPFNDKEGNAQVAFQSLMAPPKVAEALRPITDPNYLKNMPSFRRGRLFQAYIKSVELALSFFHVRALSITAGNNMGALNTIKALGSDMNSGTFKNAEQDFIKAGGTTSILGRTLEAYKSLKRSSLPENKSVIQKGFDVARSLPLIRQADQLSEKITHFTFDILQRKFKVMDFSTKRASWIARNPKATEEQLRSAEQGIAKEVNAAYGGLNWESLGINKTNQQIARFFMLAPDWTFSNFFNAKYAFEGGPAGKAARRFWTSSAITGVALTQAASMFLSGQTSPDPTSVYLGKDKNGKDIYQNMFFVGAPGDFVNLLKNIGDYGVVQGAAQSLAAKAGPLTREAMQLLTNRNYYGQQIVPKGAGLVAGTAMSALDAAKNLGPVPFSVSGPFSMLADPSGQYTPLEIATTLFSGARSRHVVPEGMRQVTSGKRKGQLVPATQRTPNDLLTQITTGKLNQPLRGTGVGVTGTRKGRGRKVSLSSFLSRTGRKKGRSAVGRLPAIRRKGSARLGSTSQSLTGGSTSARLLQPKTVKLTANINIKAPQNTVKKLTAQDIARIKQIIDKAKRRAYA